MTNELVPARDAFSALQKQYKKALVKAVRKRVVAKDVAHKHFASAGNMFYHSIETYQTLQRSHELPHIAMQYFPLDTTACYSIDSISRCYRKAIQRRLAMAEHVVQNMIQHVAQRSSIEWDMKLYSMLLSCWHYFPLDDAIVAYNFDSSWTEIEQYVKNQLGDGHVLMYPESVLLMVFSKLATYLQEHGTTADEFLHSAPLEWLVPLFWNGEVQYGILGVSPSHVNQEEVAAKHGIALQHSILYSQDDMSMLT